jgi:hypothetical protein
MFATFIAAMLVGVAKILQFPDSAFISGSAARTTLSLAMLWKVT